MNKHYKSREVAFQYCPSTQVSEDVWYCEKLDLYWHYGVVYSPDSAAHNGIIGMGAQLKEIIQREVH